MFADRGDGFHGFYSLLKMCVLCFIVRTSVPTQVSRAEQLSGAGAARGLRSRRSCHHPIHTSIRPPARLSVMARSPTLPAKAFIDDLVQVLASIWHATHVHKSGKHRAACLCIVCVSRCVCLGVSGHSIF